MNTSDLNQMLAEKGNPCVSIVVPTHRYSRERMQDPKVVHDAIRKAKDLLQNSAWPVNQIKQLNNKLDDLLEKVDYMRLYEGLAIFVSPNISKLFLLPFQVKEKIMLGKNFEIRDLFYYTQFLKTYYLLAVSKKRTRLLKGEGRDIQEITNNDFPKQQIEEYEYASPSLGSSTGSSLKGFEKDKSIVKETRQIAFFKQVDDAMDKYLQGDASLIIAGVEEELANFEHVTHHLNRLTGKIPGNYDFDALHPLADTAWKKMKEAVQTYQDNLLIKLREGKGEGITAEGIRDVWKMAKEGKGMTLLLEKDYQPKAYLDPEDDSKIFLSPPAGKYEIISDAADDVLEIVKEKGGNIVIVENGALTNYGHVAMLLRYPG